MSYVDFIKYYILEIIDKDTYYDTTKKVAVSSNNFDKNCLILGAESPLGYSVANKMMEYGYNILVTCNDINEQATICKKLKINRRNVYTLDLADCYSLNDFFTRLSTDEIVVDVLINTIETIEGDYRNIYRTNYDNPVYLLKLLKKRFSNEVKIINTLSSLYMLSYINKDEDTFNKTNNYNAYFRSKLFLLLYTQYINKNEDSNIMIINNHYVNIQNMPVALRWLTLFNKRTYNAACEIANNIDNKYSNYGYIDHLNDSIVHFRKEFDIEKLVRDTEERHKDVNFAFYIMIILKIWLTCIMMITYCILIY